MIIGTNLLVMWIPGRSGVRTESNFLSECEIQIGSSRVLKF